MAKFDINGKLKVVGYDTAYFGKDSVAVDIDVNSLEAHEDVHVFKTLPNEMSMTFEGEFTESSTKIFENIQRAQEEKQRREDKLRELVIEYVEFKLSEDYRDDNDYKHFIYEAALEWVYGRGIWDRIASTRKQEATRGA